jgi:hypothetical protein
MVVSDFEKRLGTSSERHGRVVPRVSSSSSKASGASDALGAAHADVSKIVVSIAKQINRLFAMSPPLRLPLGVRLNAEDYPVAKWYSSGIILG